MENQIVVYQPNETMRLDVRVENETVWLNQSRLGELFGVDRTVVNRHINNIYKTGELEAASTCSKIAQVQNEGGRMVCRNASLHRLTRRHGGTEFSQGAVGLTQRCLRVRLPLARPSHFVLTQSVQRPSEESRTGGLRRTLRPPRSHARFHLAFGRVPFSGLLTRKSCSRNVRSVSPATLSLPREAALCFIQIRQEAISEFVTT